jgi:predicted PurR-regulated permease PerM
VVVARTPTERSYRLAITVLAVAATVALLYFGRILIITMIVAAIIAFLLEPMVQLFMRLRMPRGMASFLVCSISLMFLYLAGLGVYTQTVLMKDDLPAYGARINELLDGAAASVEQLEGNVYRTLIPKRLQEKPPIAQPSGDSNAGAAASRAKRKKAEPEPPPATPAIQEVRVRPEPTPLVTYIYDYVRAGYDVLLMASFVPFLVYFWLAWGDHMRSRLLSTLEGEPRYTAERVLDSVGSMVRAYVIGNFLLGVFLSIASGVLFASVQLPYWIVVAPLSGFLSLVPYIGMPLALIPPLVAALPVHRDPAVYLFLFVSVALLHLFALNLLYPKFVGSRVHLNPLVATVALMFWGMLWGAIGLLLAIPITAAVRAVCENVEGWKSYGRMLGD